MDGGACWAAVHVVAKSWTWLSDFTFTFHFHALEKEMATHSNVLAWRIPGTGEPGGLPSMGSHRVGHDWSYLAAAAAAWSNLNHLLSLCLCLLFPHIHIQFQHLLKNYPVFTELHFTLCQDSVDYIFVGSLFCSVDFCVYPCANTTLLTLIYPWIGKREYP